MIRCAARTLGKLVGIHHSQIDRVITENDYLAVLNCDLDPGHVVLLLLLRRQFQIIVEAVHAANETGAVMPRRIEQLDTKITNLNRHARHAHGRL